MKNLDENKLDRFLREHAQAPTPAPPGELDAIKAAIAQEKSRMQPKRNLRRLMGVAAIIALVLVFSRNAKETPDMTNVETILNESYQTVFEGAAEDGGIEVDGVDWIALGEMVARS